MVNRVLDGLVWLKFREPAGALKGCEAPDSLELRYEVIGGDEAFQVVSRKRSLMPIRDLRNNAVAFAVRSLDRNSFHFLAYTIRLRCSFDQA